MQVLRRQPDATTTVGEGLETHAYAFIHTDDIKTRIAELFGGDMQFDVIIGNPPYQLGQSGGEAIGSFAMPIYQKFVEAAKRPRSALPAAMVTPSRWFAGGRGLDEFRKEMLTDKRLRELVDYPDARDVFPGVDIAGGISYFLVGPSNERRVRGHARLRRGQPDLAASESRTLSARRLRSVQRRQFHSREGIGNVRDRWPWDTLFRRKVAPYRKPFGLRTYFRGTEQN